MLSDDEYDDALAVTPQRDRLRCAAGFACGAGLTLIVLGSVPAAQPPLVALHATSESSVHASVPCRGAAASAGDARELPACVRAERARLSAAAAPAGGLGRAVCGGVRHDVPRVVICLVPHAQSVTDTRTYSYPTQTHATPTTISTAHTTHTDCTLRGTATSLCHAPSVHLHTSPARRLPSAPHAARSSRVMAARGSSSAGFAPAGVGWP